MLAQGRRSRALQELHQVATTRTERRLLVQANRAADSLSWVKRGLHKLATSIWECDDLEPEVQNQPQLVQLLIRALAGVVLMLVIRVETDVFAER